MQKSSINNETPAIGNVLLAAGVASKWKHYRDVHYGLYEVTKDIEGYEKSMKTHQTIIKNWMETYNEKLIEAVTNICKQEDDARYQLKFLCAGYELASGVDYSLLITCLLPPICCGYRIKPHDCVGYHNTERNGFAD